jgi:hypothetical protein
MATCAARAAREAREAKAAKAAKAARARGVALRHFMVDRMQRARHQVTSQAQDVGSD